MADADAVVPYKAGRGEWKTSSSRPQFSIENFTQFVEYNSLVLMLRIEAKHFYNNRVHRKKVAMAQRIAVGGSAANPPHLGHQAVIRALIRSGRFNSIIWIPSGTRRGKEHLVDPNHRVAMTILTFPDNWFFREGPKFIVDFHDVYGANTPACEWIRKIQIANPGAEIVWYTGADSVVPQERFNGKCEIEAAWTEGPSLMRSAKFCILPRAPFCSHPESLGLSSNFEVLNARLPGISSSDICRRIKEGERWEHLVTVKVARYIKKFGLYGWTGKDA